MPLDGIFLKNLNKEIAAIAIGGRVDKIHQPAKESIVIAMRSQAGNHKLLLSASASNPRIHFTKQAQDNPKSPPMFCMLMRKHLQNAKLLEIRQIGLDRIVHFIFDTVNEFGDHVNMTLAVEIMGRHSNIILVDENNKVIDSIKRITDEMSSVRPVLPGMSYTLVARQPRLTLYENTPTEIYAFMLEKAPHEELHKALLQALEGVSPLICREIAEYVTRGVQIAVSGLDDEQQVRLKFYLSQLADRLCGDEATPIMLLDTTGKPKDFTYYEIHQYGHTMVSRRYDSFSQLLDQFYLERDRIDRMRQRSADLLKLLVNLSERVSRKLAAQTEELAQSKERETLKVYGDLINSNLYALEKGMDKVVLNNYYLPDNPKVEIKLDPMLTPAQNAQYYYARYRKADTAEKKLKELIEQGKAELAYFDTVLDALARASVDSEISAIRAELASQGYVRNIVKKGMKEQRLAPFRYRSDDGFEILCGRNNLQNDKLTLKDSKNSDIWLHVQKMPGAHVVISAAGQEVPNRTLEQAAIIAAYHSNGRESGKIPVDYTQVRNVRKHPANKPGLVIYEPYQTAIVQADAELVASLEIS